MILPKYVGECSWAVFSGKDLVAHEFNLVDSASLKMVNSVICKNLFL
jgi:hypothetical protein